MKPDTTSSPAFTSMLMGNLSPVFAIAALALAACGGAPEVPLVDSPASKASEAFVSAPAHPTTELAGLYRYSDSANGIEYLALAIPPASINTDTEWFAWRIKGFTTNPWLYHGFFALSTDGNALSSSAGITQAKGNSAPSSVRVALTKASKSSFTSSMTDNNVINPTPSVFTAEAVQTGFDFAARALTQDLAVDLNGIWFDSGSYFLNRTLRFSTNGAVTGITLGSCPLDISLQPGTGGNYFQAIAVVYPQPDPSKGVCHWTPTSASLTLTGIALLWNTGSQVQLDMMLLDGTGAGISYRGTR